MSAVTDFEKNVLHMSQQEVDALNAIAGVIGAISTAWGFANVAKSILSALGVFSGSDPIKQLRQAIDQLSTEFQVFLRALSEQLTMLEVANQIENARTALQQLQEFAPDDAATPGIDPQWDGLRPTVEYASALVVNTLGDLAYWQRPFFPELVYSLPWGVTFIYAGSSGGGLTPPHTDLVFDWRWTLPAYLEAISIRLTVLPAVVKDYSQKAKGELSTIATTLEGYFNRIRNGMAEVGMPANHMFDCDHERWGIGCWAQLGAPVGAVELYSTFSQVDSWSGVMPSPFEPGAEWTSDDSYRKFIFRFFVRDMRSLKQLFIRTGLAAAASTLIKLKVMAGISPATIDPPGTFYGYDQPHAPTGDWSVRELAQKIFLATSGYPLPGQPPGHAPTGLPPFGLRQLLQYLQTFNPQPYTSLRAALAQ